MRRALLSLLCAPGIAAATPRDRSPSRDAPGLEVAYGPRAQLSLGVDPELLRWGPGGRPLRLDARVLLAMENADSRRPFVATETGRLLLDLGIEKLVSEPAPGPPDTLAVRASLGIEQSWRDAGVSFEGPRPWDLPFGAGGVFTAFSAAWALDRGALSLRGRLSERVYLPGWLALFGARTQADHLGGTLATGIAHAPAIELTIFARGGRFEPTAALLVEHQLPLDDAARPTFFARLMAGPAAGRAWWFLSADAGNGKGQLSVRREARFSLGVRLALP